MNRIPLPIASCLLLLPAGRAQDPPSVAELIERLAAAPAYEEATVSEEPSKVHADYVALAARAPVAQLLQLTGRDAPVLRCYALRALVDLGETKELPAILRAHAADTGKLEVRSGCERYQTNAGDLMIETARPKLTAAALLDLGEHLVRTASPLYARQWSLRNLRFRDGMLHEVRKLAADGDAPAAIALARYGIRNDVPILIEHLRRPQPFDDNCQFLAAEVSRDPQLLPVLAEVVPAARRRLQVDNPYRLRFWLQAITAQGSDEAAELLRTVLADPGVSGGRLDELRKTVREAIEAHPAPAFEPLQQQLGGQGR